MKRSSGVLLHPSSLPGPWGIGDIGYRAKAFIDWLAESGQTLWQVLPLGPTGYGDSPYASTSTFAGNPLLIAPDLLMEAGYLHPKDLIDAPTWNDGVIDFGALIPWKKRILRIAAQRFLSQRTSTESARYLRFIRDEAWWLDDYVLFSSIKDVMDQQASEEGVDGAMWSNYWPRDLALRDGGALGHWCEDSQHEADLAEKRVIQFFFFSQWDDLRAYARQRGIAIIGDIPIFVAADSVDVWANRQLFQLDANGLPIAVAGVPPDYFSETGQLWGNPLYRWDQHEQEDFAWWHRRLRSSLRLFDWLRIDHFRGFESYWAVPYGNPNAVKGVWEKAPGMALFSSLKQTLGALPILAEDLGLITEEVRELRDAFNLPGMKVLQFAFDQAESGAGFDVENQFLPHMYDKNCVVYTGTHDNDTLQGWIDKASKEELDFVRSYLGNYSADLTRNLIRLALSCVGSFVVIPMQDLAALGSDARMNTPATIGGNWTWRAREEIFALETTRFLRSTSHIYGRNLNPEEE